MRLISACFSSSSFALQQAGGSGVEEPRQGKEAAESGVKWGDGAGIERGA